jgi:hypothetical protein
MLHALGNRVAEDECFNAYGKARVFLHGFRGENARLPVPDGRSDITNTWCPERDLNPHALAGKGF